MVCLYLAWMPHCDFHFIQITVRYQQVCFDAKMALANQIIFIECQSNVKQPMRIDVPYHEKQVFGVSLCKHAFRRQFLNTLSSNA